MTDDKPDPRPHDPYRRAPATIDLKKGEFRSTPATVASAPPSQAAKPVEPAKPGEPAEIAIEAETAIEPMAATALDGGNTVSGRSAPRSAAGPAETVAVADSGAASSVADDPAAPATFARPSPAPPAGARSRGSPGGLIAASLFGGIIGAALAIGADTYWRQPPTDFESRLSALETRPRPPVTTAAPTAPADTSGLDRRVAALESGAKSLAEGVAGAKAAADAAGRKAADIADRAPPSATPGSSDSGALSGLEGRVAALEATAKAAPPADALAELGARLQAMRTEADAREKSLAAATASVQSTTSAIGGRLDGTDKKLAALAEEVAKLPPGLMQAGLRIVVAGQVSEALRSGAPLAPALAALEKLGMGGPDLAALRPYADQPAPAAAVLAAEFRPLAEKISAESQPPEGSIGERLLRMADKIVTVRAVGDGSGRDVPGLLRRIQLALDRGALPEAAATFDQLPEAARGPASAWAARLKQRVAADAAARRIGAASLSALDAPAR